MEIETRIFHPKLTELRLAKEGDKTSIAGLAVPYGQLSEDLGGFREMFQRGAFDDTVKGDGDVMADVEHDGSKKLARRVAKTLELRDGEDGLRIAFDLPGTTLGRDTAEEVRTGLLDGMSITFTDAVSEWVDAGNKLIRKVTRATLRAVTLTSYPAYRQTAGTVALRSLEEFRKSQDPAYDGSWAVAERNRIDRELHT